MRAIALLGLSFAAAAAEPGKFDYYLLSLSWSPEYCAGPGGARNPQQCGEGRRYGFVVHGLWPQFEKGWPQDCASGPRVSRAIVDKMLPIMPAEGLIQHEWSKHGTCSGLDAAGYFNLIERAFRGVKIPEDFRAPLKQINVTPDFVRRKFLAANPGLPAAGLKVSCGARFLSEIRVCLTKDLKPRPCSAGVRDQCRAPEVIMRPIR